MLTKVQPSSEEDWRALQGIYQGEGLTQRLEEEPAREREEEDRPTKP